MQRKGVTRFLVRHRLKIVSAIVAGCTTWATMTGVEKPPGIILVTIAAMLSAGFLHQGAVIHHRRKDATPVPLPPQSEQLPQ